jgi:ketosteroid isomerase-like protein
MTSNELLTQGIAAAKAGRRAEARELLMQALKLDRDSELAWLWLSGVVDTVAERRTCLQEVLAISPANAMARRGLEHLQAVEPPPVSPVPAATPTLPAVPAPVASPTPHIVPSPQVPSLEGASRLPAAAAKEKRAQGGVDWLVVVGVVGVVGVMCCIAFMLIAQFGRSQSQGAASPTDYPGEITSVVYENIAAHNAEDADRYMATLHSGAPNYDITRQTLIDMYRSYDLQHTVTDVELLKVSGDRAEVSFTLTTRKVRGPAFRDNRVVGVFIMRKEDGRWKLYDQRVDDIEYLE